MKNLGLIFLSASLVNNLILVRFLGLGTFFNITLRISVAFKTSMTMVMVMLVSSWVCWLFFYLVLTPLGADYFKIPASIVISAAVVQIAMHYIKKHQPVLINLLGNYLPMFLANCAVIGVVLLNINNKYDLLQSTFFALGNGVGGSLAILAFSALRKKLELAPVPASFKGYPIEFIAASLMSLAFMGFYGLMGLV